MMNKRTLFALCLLFSPLAGVAQQAPDSKSQPAKTWMTGVVKESPKTEADPEQAPPVPDKREATSPAKNAEANTKGDAALALARKAQNPIASMVSVPFQWNSNFGVGPNQATTHTLNVQPVFPVDAGDWTLVNRTIIPLSYIPNASRPAGGLSGAEFGFGDINHQFYFVPKSDSSFTWGIGPTLTLPTAFDDTLGTGKWLLGANAVALNVSGPWVVGGLVSQQWSVAGNSARPDVSTMTIQPFVNYNLEGGWYLTSSPVISANWNAPSADKWTVPVGGGFGRIFALGDQKVNVSLAGFKNVVTPTNGPDWSLRFQFTLLFPD